MKNIITYENITRDILYEHDVYTYDSCLSSFRKVFSNGSTFSQATEFFISEGIPYIARRLAIKCPASLERASWSTRKKAIDKSVTNFEQLCECRYFFAITCPEGVPGSQWRFRLNSLLRRIDRLQFSYECPTGVEDATFDNRLEAVRSDIYQLRFFSIYLPEGVPGDSWERRIKLINGDRADTAKLGVLCPATTPGATFEARLSVQRGNYDREYLATNSPVGIPGATIEKRLALTNNDSYRKLIIKKYASEG